MRLILLKAWPALIPIILYVLWLGYRRRKARQNGEALPGFFSGPWALTFAASLALLATSLIFYGLQQPSDSGTSYRPAELIDGQLIKDRFEP